ncbi:hypothetical protein IC235_13120 [Hymenobacter sp. BT664]|uniref:Uncharacterized protein n=1 Tax=Hymenobacter montanus TaxID=2771359 RepID=A0A927BDI0_9BACT|nr:hypothetical protein [Hymenobacter montanus]MBD2768830.1 hypothetical protein [Hymenobacter montanus]
MTINMSTGEFFIYDEKFDASTSQDSIPKIEQKGKLSLIVDNGLWKTFSFVPTNNQLDADLACGYIFYGQLLKTIKVALKNERFTDGSLEEKFILLTGLKNTRDTIARSWGSIEYSVDIKTSWDYIVINYKSANDH